VADDAKVILQLWFLNTSINCSILLPAADDLGSGQTIPMIKRCLVEFIIRCKNKEMNVSLMKIV
jgi:hypothetical protein